MSEQKEILKLCKIKKQTKEYPGGIYANLTVMSGEAVGIVGMTASGKTMLAKIITGQVKPDGGEIFFCGRRCSEKELITQTRFIDGENKIIGGLCVAENIFLGEMREFSRFFSVDGKLLHRKSTAALSKVGLNNIPPESMAYTLSVGEKKLVELARSMLNRPKLIVLDEALAALDYGFRERIKRILNAYMCAGGAIVLFGRDAEQVRLLCDKAAVLRNGELGAVCNAGDICYNDYEIYYRPKAPTDECEVILRAINLCCGRLLNNINIKLCRGKATGIAGLSQSGIHMLGEAIFGARRLERGRITVRGRSVKSIRGAIARKISYARSDLGYGRILDILNGESDIFILDSIFDGRTKEEIARLRDCMINICNRGGAVMFISEDVNEHIGLCDSVIVLKDGVQSAEFDGGHGGYDKSRIEEHVMGIF